MALSICEYLLFVQYKTKTKKVRGFEIQFFKIFRNFTPLNLPWGHEVSKKFGPDWFSRLLSTKTHKQTDRQTSKVFFFSKVKINLN